MAKVNFFIQLRFFLLFDFFLSLVHILFCGIPYYTTVVPYLYPIIIITGTQLLEVQNFGEIFLFCNVLIPCIKISELPVGKQA